MLISKDLFLIPMTVAKSLCLPLLPSVRRHIWFHFVWCCIAQGDHVKHCNFNESLCKSLSGLHEIEMTNTFEKSDCRFDQLYRV